MIHVFVADDHPVVRHGIAKIISETSDIAMSGEAERSSEIVDALHQSPTNVLILDLSLAGRGGLDTIKEIKRAYPSLPVLVFSTHAEDQFAIRALQAGASGYLQKSTSSDELVKAIRTLSNGRKYLSSSMMDTLAAYPAVDAQKPSHDGLSDRELQVLLMIAAGKKAQEIATELILSVRTINTYRARILEKMHIATNAGLVRYALDHGLIE